MTFFTGLLAPLALAAAAPLLLGAAAGPLPARDGDSDSDPQGAALARTLVEGTTADGAFRHLRAFQGIADRSGGNRAAGTPGHERSARYAGALLGAAGYEVTYQRFDFPYREPLTERLTRLGDEPRDIPVRALSYTGNTPEGGIVAPLAAATGDGCAAGDYAPGRHTGRISLIERGGCTFAEKQRNAARAGAVGVVVRNNVPGALSGTLGGPDPEALPTGGVGQEDGAALADALTTGEVTVRLELKELAEQRSTTNVIAETRGGDPSRVLMAGAHLDSVPDGPGINDNGSGAAGVLEAALRLAEADPAGRHPQRVRFALWSAEEFGLLGAEHYVRTLSGQEREQIAAYLNFDMIGSPNHGLFVYDEEAGDDGPSAAIARDINAFLAARGQTTAPTAFDGRSDYAPFREAGIPAGGTFTGAEGLKSATQAEWWGGTAQGPYDPCYHAACDDLDNINRAALDLNVKVIAHLIGSYAWRLPDTSA